MGETLLPWQTPPSRSEVSAAALLKIEAAVEHLVRLLEGSGAALPRLAETLDAIRNLLARSSRAPAAPEPLLVSSKELAQLLGVSVSSVERLRAAGRLPEPVVLTAGCLRFRLSEVRDWVAAGCPALAAREGREEGKLD
jgi:predicted DNA-binding transcriptional regulator AlpA